MALTIGYIGLGIMGKSMARNIMKAGYSVVVHNRSRQSVNELVAEGAVEAHSPAEVADQVDVVFTNLPDSPDVELVALGPQGIIEGGHPGLIYVDNSTIDKKTSTRCYKCHDIDCLACHSPCITEKPYLTVTSRSRKSC